MMNYKEIHKIYTEILEDFNFSYFEDIKSALILDEILREKKEYVVRSIDRLKKKIKGKKVFIYGAGDKNLDVNLINTALQKDNNICKIVADKALNFLNFKPDIVVTDLDGDLERILNADKQGAIIVVHAHGDNIHKLKFVKRLKNVVGTCQVKPFGLLKNFGGFTDGDRAVFLAQSFGASEIHLIAFNFDKVSTCTTNAEVKLKKLKWAKRLIKYIEKRGAKIWWR